MMLLASISWYGLLVLVLAGWVVLRLAGGRRGESRCGGLKLLGIAAIVAGVAVFWIRPGRHVQVDYTHPAPVTVVDNGVVVEHEHFPSVAYQTIHAEGLPRWVFISLGTGLVILGALMFGRGGNRPLAIKAVTLLGVGAILYAVVTFLGEAPRRSASSRPAPTVVRLEKRDMPRVTERKERKEREVRRRSRHSHAKRPTLRPDRPTDGDGRSIEELPQRAGEIPVSAELQRQASKAESKEESKEESTPQPAAEPTLASPPVPPPEPAPASLVKPSVAPVDEPKPAPADTAAQPDSAEAPAEGEPGAEAPEEPKPTTPPAEPPKEEAPEPQDPADPVEAPTAVEPAKPLERPKAEPPKPVEPKPATTESPDEVVKLEIEPRPDWVDQPDGLAGNGVYMMVVHSGVFTSVPECQRHLELAIKAAGDHYIERYRGDGASSVIDLPFSYLNEHVKKAEYAEVVHSETLASEMHQLHARLEFDNQVRSDFHRLQRNAEVVNRLWYTGGAAALVLALLATLYGYLKLDLRTAGAHKGRLQLAATLVALIAAAGVLLVRWAVPF